MNGTCAGGTGAFIDQMASLLNTDASGLNELAKNYKILYPIEMCIRDSVSFLSSKTISLILLL